MEADNLTRSFFGVRVLHGVSFALEPGRVLGMVGENGSGKTTTMNILAGVLAPDSGAMRLGGRPYAPRHPRDAQEAGVALIHQDPNLFENLSIEENLFLGRFPRRAAWWPWIHRSAIRDKTRRLLETVDVARAPTTPVGRLSAGERQLVEIAKALGANARVILFDEPTTSLTGRETERLFGIIERLKARGIGVIYISHVLGDVSRLCDEVLVLRDGAVAARGAADRLPPSRIIKAMVGRTIEQLFPPRCGRATGRPLLEVRGVSQPGVVRDISFTLHAGEVLGVAGLMGSGRTELARILFGLDPHRAGAIRVEGRPLHRPTPRRCMERGVALLTEDRRAEGLMMEGSILDNMSLPSLGAFAGRLLPFVRRRPLERAVGEMGRTVRLSHTDHRRALVKHLSGGNQQKVVLGKWLLRAPRVFILDEPTRGVDVGARHEVYKIINRLADEGAGVLMISSEIEELIGMCDRILVMSRGEVRAEHPRAAFDSRRILEAALLGGVEGVSA